MTVSRIFFLFSHSLQAKMLSLMVASSQPTPALGCARPRAMSGSFKSYFESPLVVSPAASPHLSAADTYSKSNPQNFNRQRPSPSCRTLTGLDYRPATPPSPSSSSGLESENVYGRKYGTITFKSLLNLVSSKNQKLKEKESELENWEIKIKKREAVLAEETQVVRRNIETFHSPAHR